jgi:CRP-like cAMP-binding protein
MHKEAAKRYLSGDEFAHDLIEARRAGLGASAQDHFSDADKFAALRAMRFFGRFSEPELWEVIRIGLWERASAEHVVVREGEGGDFFCILVDGEMRVTKNKKLLSLLGPGECFGEMALLHSAPRSATVTAETDMQLFVLGSRQFSALIRENPGIGQRVLAAVAQRLREAERVQPHH